MFISCCVFPTRVIFQIQLKDFIIMLPREANIFFSRSYLERKNLISQTSSFFFVTAFLFFPFPVFFGTKIEKFPLLEKDGMIPRSLFCFSLLTDGSRCNQTIVLMFDCVFCLFFFCLQPSAAENCCVPNKPSIAKQSSCLRLLHTSKLRHWRSDTYSSRVITQILNKPSN